MLAGTNGLDQFPAIWSRVVGSVGGERSAYT